MKHKYLNVWLGITFFFVVSFSASLSNATLYNISNGDTNSAVLTLSGTQTASDYYSYVYPSGDPAFGTIIRTAFFWLYEDTIGNISLSMIYNTEGIGGYGKVYTTISGLPSDSLFQVKDDPADINGTLIIINDEWSFRFTWRDHTDGAVIQLNGSWEEIILNITGFNDYDGIDYAYFLSGDLLDPDRIVLDLSKPLIINSIPELQTVDIDIKPGSYPNCFKVDGHGVIPIAVLGSETFDVTQIDITTLKFAGLDVRVKGNSRPQCSVEDVSGDFTNPEGAPDGYDDLVCQFVDDTSVWSPDNGFASLIGELYDEIVIEGSDTICIVPK